MQPYIVSLVCQHIDMNAILASLASYYVNSAMNAIIIKTLLFETGLIHNDAMNATSITCEMAHLLLACEMTSDTQKYNEQDRCTE